MSGEDRIEETETKEYIRAVSNGVFPDQIAHLRRLEIIKAIQEGRITADGTADFNSSYLLEKAGVKVADNKFNPAEVQKYLGRSITTVFEEGKAR